MFQPSITSNRNIVNSIVRRNNYRFTNLGNRIVTTIPTSVEKASQSNDPMDPQNPITNDATTIAATVVEEKKILRKTIRTRLKELSISDIQEQSSRVWDQLCQRNEFDKAKSIGLFLSMPSGEINTEEIIKRCTQQSKTIYVPIVGKNFEFADMELIKVPIAENESGLFYDNWPRNKWNIPEPPEDMVLVAAQPGDLDLIVVPGLAFDLSGNRLGQGKGYYDRFLSRMMQVDQPNKVKVPFLVGVGLDCQLLPTMNTIPTNEYDFPLDMIITPSEIIIPSKD